MKALVLACLVLPLAGCLVVPDDPQPRERPCAERPHSDRQLYLAADRTLAGTPGASGEEALNDGHEAFTAEQWPWLSDGVAEGVHVSMATVRLAFRVEGTNPYSPDTTGTQLLVQFGSDRAYAPFVLAVPNSRIVDDGSWQVFESPLPLPYGGVTLETGDRFALLVTSLVQGPAGPGVTVRFGNDTLSGLRLHVSCADARHWQVLSERSVPVSLPAHQGLFTDALPPHEGLNRLTVPFDIPEGAGRVTVTLAQSNASDPKDDMDLYLLDGARKVVWQAGSPGADETMVLWPENLEALRPGPHTARVDSYSGVAYEGTLTIRVEAVAAA